MSIWAHTLVKNEERYVWFAVMSVIDHVDRILIWDTGSSDGTVQIISEIQKLYPEKVSFKEVGEVDINQFTIVRQKMLDQTQADWFIIVDGDEVWWDSSIKEVVDVIKKDGNNLDSVVSKYHNVIGDIYHFQEEKAGRYNIDGFSGHYNIRAVNRNISGLHFSKPHGQQGLFDNDNKLIQERDAIKRQLLDGFSYLHFTNMIRSRDLLKDSEVIKRNIKYKYELGKNFSLDFYYPEVFFRNNPNCIDNPWISMNYDYFVKSAVQTPLKLLKRRLIKTSKSGY